MSLTDAQIRAFKPSAKRFRRSDGAGLFLDVMPSGKKIFRLAYRSQGKQRTAWIGDYPATGLANARLKAAKYRMALRDGIDPKDATAPETKLDEEDGSQAHLWGAIARDYLMLRQRSGAAVRTMAKLERQVAVTVAALGDRAIGSISAEDILAVVNPIAEKGRVENAHEIRSRFSQIFRYAAARGLISHDPAALTIDAMVARRRGEFSGITEPRAVGKLISDIRAYQERHFVVGSALLLSAYLFPRNTELRGMRWEEVNEEQALWEVPGDRMKMKRDHIVPLPRVRIHNQ